MDHIVLPRFWSEKPALWFAQVEAIFALNRITSDADKYDNIVSELSQDVISLVEDIILNPPENEVDDRYGYLKHEVIERLSIKRLEAEKIRTMKPSEFLEHLQTIADPSVSEQTVKGIWIDGLPSHVRDIIDGENFDDLHAIVKIADKVFDACPSKSACSSTIELEKKIDKLLEQIEVLNKRVIDLQMTVQGNVEICNCICTNIEGKPKHDENTNQICWYHKKFGYKATKCITPCSYYEKNVTQEL